MFDPGEEARRSGRASVDAILQFAWDAETFTSNDAMPVVGLTRSTTIEAIDELIARGLVHELSNARAGGEYRKGRPARRFAFRADAGVVVGVDAGRAHIVAMVADLRGRVLHSATSEPGEDHDSVDERREAVESAIDDALIAAGVSRADVVAVCLGVPAPVDRSGRSPRHRDGFWDRMNPGLIDLVAEWAPVVRVENDASLTAVAEGSVGAAVGCRDFVALLAGMRLGAGIVVDGALLRGTHGGAGEMVAFDNVVGVGEVGGIGYRIGEWVREAVAAGDILPGHPLARGGITVDTPRRVLQLAREGDVSAQGIVERAGSMVARVAGVFGSILDSERIVVSGAVSDDIEDVLVVARRLLPTELDLPAPHLVASPLGAEVVAVGAVAAAVESARRGILALASMSVPASV
ncbi:ROK family protein [Microbacterium sp. SLBN-146]|uniref:ROK family protein n=1 Tax=Microbacterium sp. SLBN-146 TaxID=2768457 RepID=UPI00114EE2FB|nr:ROK family protein [Microbacterium sp. SLBN-146]TQJ30766.1 putative NBD/HSP70 family sugar kinase [Microbacterium sp. SLBN-146]